MSRWPLPPPKGERCDAYATCPPGCPITRDPHVHRCGNDAVETCREVLWGRDTWLCGPCRDGLVAKGSVYRNPRKYGPPPAAKLLRGQR